jgi:hypothetical protein
MKASQVNFLIIYLLIYTLAVVPKPFEGSQVEINKDAKLLDWWGNISPAIPRLFRLEDSSERWYFFYLVLSMMGYIGLQKLIGTPSKINEISDLLKIAIYYFTLLFILHGSRDGVLLAFTILGLSLVIRVVEFKNLNSFKGFLYALSALAILAIGALFKLPILPIVIISLYLILFQVAKRNSKQIFFIFAISLLIPMFALIGDKQIKDLYGIVDSYPQQQVMFYDLSGVYCWSASSQARFFVENKIKPHLSDGVEARELCASLTPYGWDTLRMPYIDSSISPPIRIIQPADDDRYIQLQKDWISTISGFPKEWFIFKLNLLGQSLFMSNAFSRGASTLNLDWSSLLSFMKSLVLVPAIFLDNLYFLSFFSAILFAALISIYRTRKQQFLLLLFLIFSIINTLITYVANNGRYVIAAILIYLIFQYRLIYPNKTYL